MPALRPRLGILQSVPLEQKQKVRHQEPEAVSTTGPGSRDETEEKGADARRQGGTPGGFSDT